MLVLPSATEVRPPELTALTSGYTQKAEQTSRTNPGIGTIV